MIPIAKKTMEKWKKTWKSGKHGFLHFQVNYLEKFLEVSGRFFIASDRMKHEVTIVGGLTGVKV